jgi:hypothetical protein
VNARFLCAMFLLCFGLNAYAVDFYEFEGYFVSRNEGSVPAAQLPGPGEKFHGWVVYDGDRKFRRADDFHTSPIDAAPLVSVYLETQSGYTISSTNNDGSTGFSIGSATTPPQPVDTVGYGVSAASDEFIYVGGSPFHGGLFFSWASTEPGQVPELNLEIDNVDSLAPVHLRPNSWTLLISIAGQCPELCEASTLKGHITRFGSVTSVHNEFFDAAPVGWTTSGGAWTAENGNYRNVANVAFTSTVYRGLQLTGEYDLHTGMFSQWRASGNTLGLLLHYRDNANFDEIRFNASGAITYTRVTRGARKVLRSAQYPVEVPGAFGAFVARRDNQLDFWAGARVLFSVDMGTLRGGYAGFFSSWNQARFPEFRLFVQHSWKVSHSDFGTSAAGWTSVAGAWTPVDGYFYSSSNLAATIATSEPIAASAYTVDTSLFLEWSNAGNQGGVIYDYVDPSNYRAVLVACGTCRVGVTAPTLHVVEVVNGVRRVLLSSTSAPEILPRQWATVGVRRIGELTEITVQATPIIRLKQTIVVGSKRAGLIARFNKVRFDNVVVGVPP